MSFGAGNYSITLGNKIQEAVQSGILVIASAGNNGANGGLQYPACYDGVMAVASVGTDMQRVDSSAIGEGLLISAPGDQGLSMGLINGVQVCVCSSHSVGKSHYVDSTYGCTYTIKQFP